MAAETDWCAWREQYEASLKTPTGWLALAGLLWLKEGANTIGSAEGKDVRLPVGAPPDVGTVVLQEGKVLLNGAEMQLEEQKVEVSTTVTIMAIKRGQRWAIRVWDANASTLTHFTGIEWFPYNPRARVEAKWTLYPEPKTIQIPNVLGDLEDNVVLGSAEFEWDGITCTLEPVVEGNSLFLMFRDQTSNTGETYGSGRFLDVDMPGSSVSTVVLDFNRSRNPPCSLSNFATCPVPPRNNWLRVRMEAGSRKYGDH